ncbi:MAG TPA: phosphatidate cytidylyltransferase [Acidimicrobiales bacterium]|jgi:CDP-diglyceride synthetase|nr:phosphatidate cytidylyltransferase [Acidimicrobiales bacterium]
MDQHEDTQGRPPRPSHGDDIRIIGSEEAGSTASVDLTRPLLSAVDSADRGPGGEGSQGERPGAGADDDLSDWASPRAQAGGRTFELDDLDDPEQTGPFQSQPPKSPPSRPGRQTPSTPVSPRQGRPRGGDLTTRVLTGLGIGLAAVILFRLGSLTSLVLVLLIVTAAAAELFGVLRRAGYRPATLVALVATVGILIGAYMKGEAAIPLVLGLVVVFTLLWYLVGVVRERPTVNVAVTLLGFMWVGFLGSFAALLLDPRMFPNRHGVALLLGAAVVTVGYDVGSFLVGGRFGRHHLAPAISPNKTWEGLIGGTLASVLVGAVVVSQISPWNTARGVALGLVVAVAAPLGDLCESLLKRDMGVKDMGWILPGHGGVLDRVDALLFVVPATYYLVRLINFGG